MKPPEESRFYSPKCLLVGFRLNICLRIPTLKIEETLKGEPTVSFTWPRWPRVCCGPRPHTTAIGTLSWPRPFSGPSQKHQT